MRVLNSNPIDNLSQRIVHELPDCIKVLHQDGTLAFINDQGLALLAVDREQVIGKTWADFWGGEDRQKALHGVERARDGESTSFLGYLAIQGEPRWWDVWITPIQDEPGNPQILVVSRDVTKRVQAEAQVKDRAHEISQLNERLKAALSGINDHLVSYDRRWCFTYINEAGARILGKKVEELLGHCIWEVFPEAVGNQYYRELHQSLAEQRVIRSEHFYEPMQKWFENHIYPTPEGVTVFSSDITWRKEADEKLRRSEMLYRGIGESINYGIWVCDATGKNIYASDSFLKLVGLTQEECSEFGWGRVLHPDDRAATIEAWKRSVQEGKFWEREHRFLGVDGEMHYLLARGVPIRNDQQEVVAWAGINLDIDAFKKSETALRTHANRLEILNRFANTIVAELQLDRLVKSATDTAREICGAQWAAFYYFHDERPRGCLSPFAVSGFSEVEMETSWCDFTLDVPLAGCVRTGDVKKNPGSGRAFLDAKGPFGKLPIRSLLAMPVVSRSGATLGVITCGDSQANIFSEEDEQIMGSLAAQTALAIDNAKLYDQLQRQLAEAKKAELNQARLAAIVASSDDAIFSYDLNGVLTSWNEGAERMFGYSASEMIGRTLECLVPMDRKGEEFRILDKVRHGEKVDHFETVRQRKDGHLLDLSITVSPIKNHEGVIVGASKIARDISQAKQQERSKDLFFATLSHELRTPLAPLLFNVDILRRPNLTSAEKERVLNSLERNIKAEVRLVDELLDLSKVIHRKLELQLEPLPGNELVREIVTNFAHKLKSFQMETKWEATQDTVIGDRVRIQQVLSNLLENAIKFTPEGKRITVGTFNQTGHFGFYVADQGRGFTGDPASLFLPFRQERDENSRNVGGLGLGLSVCNALVEAHGGSIQAESAGRDQGSKFVVLLKLATP